MSSGDDEINNVYNKKSWTSINKADEDASGWGEHDTKRRALICSWFPFPTVVTIVHNVNWSIGGIALTAYFRLSVHISVASCFA